MYSMSSNKTPCFQLHSWEPGDNFLLSEINENFALLDGAAWIVTGSYMGDNTVGREIDLGFAPRAVFFCDKMGRAGYFTGYSYIAGGLMIPGCPLTGTSSGMAAELTDRGFRLYQGTYNMVNTGGPFRYIALR